MSGESGGIVKRKSIKDSIKAIRVDKEAISDGIFVIFDDF